MSAATSLKYLYFAYFSKPVGERVLYRSVRRHRVTRILELGLHDARRAKRLIAMASHQAGGCADVSYTGIDLFEARPASQQGLPLKRVHQLLTATGAKIKLVPGDPFEALARSANSLTGTDIVLISADQDADALQRAWFYLPRVLHERSVAFWQQPASDDSGEGIYRRVCRSDIDAMAEAGNCYRAA